MVKTKNEIILFIRHPIVGTCAFFPFLKTADDIKVVLFVGYAIGYPVAVLPTIFVDPVTYTHVLYGSRHYEYAFLCLPIYLLLLLSICFLFLNKLTSFQLYYSAWMFLVAIAITLPIFLPEFPHADVFVAGMVTTFIAFVSIFVWSFNKRTLLDQNSLESARNATLEYLKEIMTYFRWLVSTILISAGYYFFLNVYKTGLQYAEVSVIDPKDRFLLFANLGFRMGFYAVFILLGPVRLLFNLYWTLLEQSKIIAMKIDGKETSDEP